MSVIKAILGIGVLAGVAALPWIVQDHLVIADQQASSRPYESTGAIQQSNSVGSNWMATVKGWFSTGNSKSQSTAGAEFASSNSTSSSGKTELQTSHLAEVAEARVTPTLVPELKKAGLKLGDPVFMRIFKEESELEVWMLGDGKSEYELFKTYKICNFSGKLGPKLKEGDRQAPEGFYFVPPSQMNPNSQFHLSFDLGFPNKYDQYHDRSGTFLMVHGDCVSIGCYAMTDARIEEIYTLAARAIKGGQKFFRVHAFPFHMTDQRMNEESRKKAKWLEFWANLKEGYDYFEMVKHPPNVSVNGGSYTFGSQ